jgi:DNA-binding NarL/FixJ family response regulator
MINVVIVDDNPSVRHNMQALLETESDLRIVGEAADAFEAVRMVESLKPDVLVVDLTIGGMNGIDIIKQTGKCSPQTNVVVFSLHVNEAYVDEALRAGARAYVIKESSSGELVQAIREVVGGHRYFSLPLSEKSIETYWKIASEQNWDGGE